MTGELFCDSSNHKPMTIAGQPYFANALKGGGFTVGEFAVGRITGRNIILFALPFYGNDARIGGVVKAALSLDWLAASIARKGVPPGGALAITDRNGTVLARYPSNEQFVGRKIPDDRYLRANHPDTADTRDVDGVERIIGYSALQADSGGLLVSFGLDKVQAFTEIQRRAQRGILLIILSTSLVLILTWLGARRFIDRPLGQLVEAANRWRVGDYVRRVNIREKQSEIALVGDAFNIMADALQDRERELREAKEKAEHAADRITTIFESTTDSVAIFDRDWRITYLNERAKVQVAEGRDLIGMDLWEAFPECPVQREVYRRFLASKSHQRPTSFEMFSPPRNAWYAINMFPSSEGLAVYFRDVTEHKRAVEARRLMEEQLHQSQKMEAVGQLTGGVAHDFNNLLTVVLGNLVFIERRAWDNDSVRKLAAAARQAADRGAKLTAQLLAFSRRQRLNPKVVCAYHLIHEFQGLIRRAVGVGCEIKLTTDEQLWPCYVDPVQLETALLNLSLNGRDAMPDGGVLEIEARNVVLDDGAVAGLAAGPYVSLSVTDTGCGIPPETLDRVFEPFFTTKEVGKGTGLGLSMVYGFVKQSGGHITIESAVGVGTKVTLHLPKAAPSCETEVKEVWAQASPPGSARILVVEDDEDVLEVTSAMLTELGYQVLCAGNGADAIHMLKSDKGFDLLFSDVQMPQGMSGIELAREAKRLRNGIKVLLTSGYAEDVLARHRAVDEFLVIDKPFRQADLARCLRSVLYGA
jgi:signal transduction histidine kinase